MRVSSAPVLALAALTVAGCSGPGAALPAKPSPAPPAAPRAVGCDQIIQQVGPPGGRVVLGVLAVPPARLGRAAPTGTRPWAYFAKHGIDIRAGSPAVLVTVPAAWRRRAAIAWGNNVGAVSSLRLLSCPRQLGAWNGYAGGFYLRSASGCVPLVLQIGRRTAALRVAIGSSTCGSAT
jgi:hypothetical protein